MRAILDGLLDRPRTILTLMIFLLGAGAFIYTTIPKEANPDIDVPVFYVSITQQGISPEDANRLLVKPMETQLRGLDGLKEIRATASEGHAGIILEFEADFDKDEALGDVRDKVDTAKADLPADAEEPVIVETNFSLVPTIIVALSGDVPERTLYQHARRLKDAIEAVPSVLLAELSGSREEQLEVLIDRTAMESYGVQPVELLQAINNNNALIPAGFIDTGEGRFSVKVPGLVEDGIDVFNMVIKQNAEGIVTVGDIAEVRRNFKDAESFTRVNGRPAITVNVVKRLGENIILNNQAVRDVVDEMTKDWPSTIKIDFLLDESSFIYEVLGSLEASISTAIVLVMIVVLSALGFRSALLVGIAIPTSILLGFTVLSGLGMTVNMMVMFGLVLCVGLLVDGAIVMVEYADRRIAEGASRLEAFREAAHLMVWPLTSSTATTLIAFLPMLLWPGIPGEFMSYLPVMVIIVLTVALITALVFLPVVGSVLSDQLIIGLAAGIVVAGVAMVLLSPGSMPLAVAAALVGFLLTAIFATKLAGRWGRFRRTPPAVDRSGPFDVSKVRGLTGLYVRLLKPLAGTTAGIILTIVFVFGVSFAVLNIFANNAAGVEFFVEEEPDVAVVLISARGNMSADEALGLVREVESKVLTVDGVDNVVTSAYPSGTNVASGGQVGGVQDKPVDLIGELQIELVDYCCRRPAAGIFEDIRRLATVPGLKVEVRKIEGGPPTGKDIQLQISSESYDKVVATTAILRDHFETVEGLRDVEDTRPLPGIEWQLEVNREEAGRFGADITNVGQVIQLVTNGVLLSEYQPEDAEEQIDIRVRYPQAERSLDEFANLRLPTDRGQVPLSNFITVTPQPRVSTIERVDGQFAMTVKADVLEQEGYDLNAKIAEIDTWVQSQTWPDGVLFKFRGANEDQAESMAFLMKAMVASLVMMFIVLVTQFNSFYQTALTLVTIVLSVFGVLLGMALTGQKFSVIMTGTGIIALAGIVVNNAIVLIDTFNRERTTQPDLLSATLATAAQRVRPILLTTITTIAGLIPMATQVNLDFFTRTVAVGSITAVWWVQLSTAVIAGLAFSTLLTLVAIPVMLAMPQTVSRTYARLRGRFTGVEVGDLPTGGMEPALAGIATGGAAPMPAAPLPAAAMPAAAMTPAPAAPPAQEPSPPKVLPFAPATEDGAASPGDVYAPVIGATRPRRDVDDAAPESATMTDPAPTRTAQAPLSQAPDSDAPAPSATEDAAPDVYAPVTARARPPRTAAPVAGSATPDAPVAASDAPMRAEADAQAAPANATAREGAMDPPDVYAPVLARHPRRDRGEEEPPQRRPNSEAAE